MNRHRLIALTSTVLMFSLAGCGSYDPSPEDGSPDADVEVREALTLPPQASPQAGDVTAHLVCQGPPGLYENGSCSKLASGVRPYEPAYALWSDGAEKERFIYLPPGSKIDTQNPDRWRFQVGTRLYKTFAVDGRRIETRLIEKVADGAGVGASEPMLGTPSSGTQRWLLRTACPTRSARATTFLPRQRACGATAFLETWMSSMASALCS